MHTPEGSPLGAATPYPRRYDPTLLYAIPRASSRAALGLPSGEPLPFIGHDRWQAFELGWLNGRGRPVVATATLVVPAQSPNLIESKSLKLYFNSWNAEHVADAETLRAQVQADLSRAAGAPVTMHWGVAPMAAADAGECIDTLDIDIEPQPHPDPDQLRVADGATEETLVSHLLKSNCPVTGQPDWATLRISYQGPRIDQAGLLRYITGFREHGDFHEACVECIFMDVLVRCRPRVLSVEARYTRRGGLDINPWRATPGSVTPSAQREIRQ